MNLANAIAPKMNRHSITSTTKLFVGLGTFSGNFTISIVTSYRSGDSGALI
jgi:hypothetical protein